MSSTRQPEERRTTRCKAAWLVGAAVASLAVAAALTLWYIDLPEPGSVRARYDSVRLGMTEEEVNRAMGGPPGIYGGVWGPNEALLGWYDESGGYAGMAWYFEGRHSVTVFLDEGRVWKKEMDPPHPTLLDRLKAVWSRIW
jgi:hypothetical protein